MAHTIGAMASRLPAYAVLLLGLLAAACASTSGVGDAAKARVRAGTRVAGATPGSLRSNVSRDDYAGSAVCAKCHEDVAAAWARSPMHRMTRTARGAEVRAPFDGTRWPFKDDAVTLYQRDGERFVRIDSGGGVLPHTYRVTRVVGGRTREDFVGVDVATAAAGGAGAGSGDEVVLPVSFVFATRALRYKGYSVMLHERASLRAGPVWSRTCIFCHNTIPEVDRLLGALAGPGAHAYQGEQVDRLLPAERRARARVVDDAAFGDVMAREIASLHDAPLPSGLAARDVARQAIASVRSGFEGTDLVEEGIGCEACHGGAKEHARDPKVHPSFVPVAPWLSVELPAGPAQGVNRACARCHQVLFSRYPYTWEGGRRDAMPGGSHINSGEARDFLLGGCSSAMACTSCHDPHGADDPGGLRKLATPAGNPTCTKCHAELATPERLRAHAHHDPSGAGGSCVACHMPRKNMGLDGKLTRYHRIGSPTDPARVLGDRPLECALCHADRTVRQLVDSMEAWWPRRYPRQRLEELYGSLDAVVMKATLDRGKAHEQAVAIGVLAESRAPGAAALIAPQLANEYPLVREWARRALDGLGAPAVNPSPVPAPARSSDDGDPED
jgi:predicted CXXCH cytochrome family protein